ncbi:glycosyltransferase family 2 protein [Leucobacter iarius]|uniref:Glycosyltransferase 2-like domain-containing protein n=1 Tax=Leucobacter iarius TaxID=333963 RepID=A0ABN2L9L3_9MICO
MRTGAVELSVVIPTRNSAPWLVETLDSVLEQGVERLEVLVVDDGSTDGTREIVRRYAEDDRVLLLDSDGRGVGSARNTGAARARGRRLIFCDPDGLVPDGAYSALLASLDETGSDLALGDYLGFGPTDTRRPTDGIDAYSETLRRSCAAEEPTLLLSRRSGNAMFVREWWEAEGIRFPDSGAADDILPMSEALLRAGAVDLVPDVVYLDRTRAGDSRGDVVATLRRELECANLVGAAGDPGISDVYAELVYERDALDGVRDYLAGWTGPAEADGAIRDALQDLLEATAAPSAHADPLRTTAVRLAADGDFAAGRTLVRALRGERSDPDAAALRDWAAVLEYLAPGGRLGDRSAARLLGALRPLLVMPSAADAPAEWQRVIRGIREVLGTAALARLPEASGDGAPDRTAQLLRFRARADVRLLEIEQRGRELVLLGRSALGPDLIEPLLHRMERSGLPELVLSTVWRQSADGGWAWTASAPIADLPLREALLPAFRGSDGSAAISISISMRCEASEPVYRPKDAVRYEAAAGSIVVRRRRHWILRAGRRALGALRDRVVRRTSG